MGLHTLQEMEELPLPEGVRRYELTPKGEVPGALWLRRQDDCWVVCFDPGGLHVKLVRETPLTAAAINEIGTLVRRCDVISRTLEATPQMVGSVQSLVGGLKLHEAAGFFETTSAEGWVNTLGAIISEMQEASKAKSVELRAIAASLIAYGAVHLRAHTGRGTSELPLRDLI